MAESNNARVLLPSAARTATVSTPDQTNFNRRGVEVIINTTVDGAAASVTPTIEGKDPASGEYYAILTGAAVAATGTVVLRVYPGLAAVANVAVSAVLPRTWRVTMTAADTDSLTYSIGVVESA